MADHDVASATGAADTPSILTKAFDLLQAFNSNARVMTLSEISRASGLPKSTVHRLLARLIELHAIEPHLDGYKLGLAFLQLAATTPAWYMREVAMPHLAQLHRWTGHTVSLGVLRDYDVVYLEKFGAPTSPSTIARVGARLPAHSTALGKALLAYENLDDLANFLPSPLPTMTPQTTTRGEDLIPELRTIRDEGLAHERDEAQRGLACLAAPVVMRGFAVAAVSVGFPSDIVTPTGLDQALRTLVATIARETSRGLAQGHEDWFPREH